MHDAIDNKSYTSNLIFYMTSQEFKAECHMHKHKLFFDVLTSSTWPLSIFKIKVALSFVYTITSHGTFCIGASSGLNLTFDHWLQYSCLHSLLPIHRAIQILLTDSEMFADFRHWLLEQKIPVFYKFWPVKLPINLAPFGKPVVFPLF